MCCEIHDPGALPMGQAYQYPLNMMLGADPSQCEHCEENISCPCRNWINIPRTCSLQPGHYTNWAPFVCVCVCPSVNILWKILTTYTIGLGFHRTDYMQPLRKTLIFQLNINIVNLNTNWQTDRQTACHNQHNSRFIGNLHFFLIETVQLFILIGCKFILIFPPSWALII